MNNLLNQQLDELLTNARIPSTNLRCEGALRVGAATLYRAAPHEITATTVVCDLEGADMHTFQSLIQEIADDYGLDAGIQQQLGSCSVRFTCALPSVAPLQVKEPEKSILARLLRR